MEQQAKLDAGYLGVDSVEDVVYRGKNAQGETGIFNTHAVPYAIDRDEVFRSNGFFTMSDMIWEIPVDQMQTIRREEGDVIERGNGEKWSILSVKLIDFERTWQFITRKER